MQRRQLCAATYLKLDAALMFNKAKGLCCLSRSKHNESKYSKTFTLKHRMDLAADQSCWSPESCGCKTNHGACLSSQAHAVQLHWDHQGHLFRIGNLFVTGVNNFCITVATHNTFYVVARCNTKQKAVTSLDCQLQKVGQLSVAVTKPANFGCHTFCASRLSDQ